MSLLSSLLSFHFKMEASILFPEIALCSQQAIAPSQRSRSRRRRLNKKTRLRAMKEMVVIDPLLPLMPLVEPLPLFNLAKIGASSTMLVAPSLSLDEPTPPLLSSDELFFYERLPPPDGVSTVEGKGPEVGYIVVQVDIEPGRKKKITYSFTNLVVDGRHYDLQP